MVKGLFWLWLALVIVGTGCAMLIDLTVQQDYRQSANDPQIQMAGDLASELKNSVDKCDQLPTKAITTTLAPFVDVFDTNGTAVNFCLPAVQNVAAIGQINNHLPTLPKGIFSFARAHGTAHFTWQPEPGQRFAAVVSYYHGDNSGYVLAARSLKEVEKRERTLDETVLLAWALSMIIISTGFGLVYRQNLSTKKS